MVRVGPLIDAARKRAGIVVPEASGAGLARWIGKTGVIYRDGGFFRGIEPAIRIGWPLEDQYLGNVG